MRPTTWKFLIIFFPIMFSVDSEQTNFDERLYKLVNEVVEEYFQVFKCLTFASDVATNVAYLEKTLPLIVINPFELRKGKLLTETFEQGCGGYIIQTRPENRLFMVDMLLDAKNETIAYRYNRQRYLFLPAAENDTDRSVLFHRGLLYLPNFLFVSPEDSEWFSIITHSVFDPWNREGFEMVDSWSPTQGYKQKRVLYPDRIKNINGKKLVFGVMHYVPYSVVVHEERKIFLDGLEGRIGIEFVKMINGTYDGLDHPVELWGDKFPNGSGNGIFGSVQRGEADLGYSAIYQWYCDVLDCTYPYVQAEVTCLVPKPEILTSWRTIYLPLAPSAWFGLCLVYVFSSLFLFGMNLATYHFQGVKTSGRVFSTLWRSAYILFRLQFQQTPKSSRESSLISNYIKICYLYFFLVALFWQGGIASILTIPRYEKPINTAGDLLSRYPDVKWGANHDVWIHSIENSTDPVLREIVTKFVVMPYDRLIEAAKRRKFGFFMERLHGNGHFGFSEYINAETIPYLRLMDDFMYTGFPVIILPKGSPYLEKIDHLIHWMFDTGIMLKMETQVSLEVIDNHLQNMIKFSGVQKSGKAILTVGHMKGPLVLYLIGIIISTMVFFIEKCLYWHGGGIKKRRKIPHPRG